MPCGSASTVAAVHDTAEANRRLASLLSIYPDAEPDYLRYCLTCYNDNHIERIVDKISSNNGEYPRKSLLAFADAVQRQNQQLGQLNAMFPECEVAVLRGAMEKPDYDCVRAATEALLKKDGKYPRRLNQGEIRSDEQFRSVSYVKGTQYQLYNDFPLIWKSTVRAVMAEVNNDYLLSHQRLQRLETSGWWNKLFNFIKRKRYVDPELQCPELLADIAQLNQARLEEQSNSDHEEARRLNDREYEAANQLITCGCCFGEYAFEDMCACEAAHIFCCECVKRYVAEGLFGAGTLRGKPIQCIDADGCEAQFSAQVLEQVLPPDVYIHYSESLLEDELRGLTLPLIRCPFCIYCEVDDAFSPFRKLRMPKLISATLQFTIYASMSLLSGGLRPLIHLIRIAFAFCSICLLVGGVGNGGILAGSNLTEEWSAFIDMFKRKRDIQLFNCLNPNCGKTSCIQCQKEARPHHKCMEKDQDRLRLYVERAMAAVHLRTCPNCHVSFEKSDGCNKMTCRCGYIMCYICRKEIKTESYKHFCDHFRTVPGQRCTQCRKCDLYKVEDEDAAIKEAAARAQAEFLLANPELRRCVNGTQMHRQPIGPPRKQTTLTSFVKTLNVAVIRKIIDYLFD